MSEQTTRTRPRHSSDARSESVSRTVTNVSTHTQSLPEVGEVQFRRDNLGVVAYYQTGAPLYIVTGHGKTEAEAEENARRKAADLSKPYLVAADTDDDADLTF